MTGHRRPPSGRPDGRWPSPPPPDTSRGQALLILNALEDRRFTLDRIMEDRRPAIDRLPLRDRALTQALVYGVLRWRSRLDALIGACLSTPERRVDPEVRNILRLGLLQLTAMDRIPASAAVHTAVDLARATGKHGQAGFVNAVLRQVQRQGVDALLTPPPGDPAAAMALAQAMPVWMSERWLSRYGQTQAEAFCRAMNTVAPLVGRVNTLACRRQDLIAELAAAGLGAAPTAVSPDGVVISGCAIPIADIPAIAQGRLRIQDEGAQLVSLIVDPKPGETILDACAGRGGKTGHLAQRMEGRGRLLAVDSDARRLEALAADMPRLSVGCVEIRCLDLNQPVPPGVMGPFDRILVDAPCSGMGVIRRNPDTKWVRQPADLARYARRQERFLNHLAPLVRPSGVLVYAVCSLEPEETTDVVTRFLDRHPDFRRACPPADGGFNLTGLVDAQGCFRSTPHHHDMDGFFAATLNRNP